MRNNFKPGGKKLNKMVRDSEIDNLWNEREEEIEVSGIYDNTIITDNEKDETSEEEESEDTNRDNER